jgi:MFS family permease
MSEVSRSAPGAASAQATEPASKRRTPGQLISISIFWFAINFHWAALPIFIVPPQIILLLYRSAPAGVDPVTWVNDNKAAALAVVVVPGLIVALIANPLFGLLSDRTPGRLGRRRPYVLFGTLANVVGLALMAFLPNLLTQDHNGQILSSGMLMLIAGLMLVQLANNAAAAPFHALLPDLVPAEQRGTASGIMGLAYWLGTVCGSLLPFLFSLDYANLLDGKQSAGDLQHQIVLAYAVIAGVVLLMALLTIAFVRETPWHSSEMSAAKRADERHTVRDLALTVLGVLGVVAITQGLFSATGHGFSAGSVQIVELLGVIVAGIGAARAFGFRPRRNPDFSWVVLTRLLVMMGVYIIQTFLQYYMRDVAHVDPSKGTSEFLILLTVAATLSTALGGWASDRIGRKRMVYVSGVFMAIVGAAFVAAPYIAPGNVFTLALGAAAIFGLGYGAYISVDWALVADVLPNDETFARDMGVWNICLTLPQVMAAVFGAWLLTWFGNGNLGYSTLFIFFVIFCLAGTVTVRNIRGVPR